MDSSFGGSIPLGGEPGDAPAGAAGSAPASDGIDYAGQLWRDLLALDQQLFDQRNIRLLTPEARVLMHLRANGPMPVTAAIQVAGTSYRGFYAVIERLRQAGIVSTLKDENDQRVRNLSINPSAAALP